MSGPEAILNAFLLTLQVSLVSTVLSVILGIAGGFWIARVSFPGRTLVDGLFTLPLVLPPTVLGYYLIILLGSQGILGKYLESWFGFTLMFQIQGAILAATVVSFPLVYRAARNAFENLNPEFEDIASSLGKRGWQLFVLVQLPMSWKPILAGIMLAYARAVGEFGATLMVAGNIPGKTRTLSLAIYSAVEAGDTNLALILSFLASLLCLIVIMVSQKLMTGSRID